MIFQNSALLEQEKNDLLEKNTSRLNFINDNSNARLDKQKSEFNSAYNDLCNRISLLETEKKILLNNAKSQESLQNENENLKLRLFNQTNDFNNQANDLKIKMALLEQEKNDLLEQNSNEMRILTVIIIIIHFLEQKIAK
jgi:hypothetical protein